MEIQIRLLIDNPPQERKTAPAICRDFVSLSKARRLLSRNQTWANNLRGDLQMHTRWSDGSGTVAEMANAAIERSYQYIAITDHSKGLKIAGGIALRAKLSPQQIVNLIKIVRLSGVLSASSNFG